MKNIYKIKNIDIEFSLLNSSSNENYLDLYLFSDNFVSINVSGKMIDDSIIKKSISVFISKLTFSINYQLYDFPPSLTTVDTETLFVKTINGEFLPPDSFISNEFTEKDFLIGKEIHNNIIDFLIENNIIKDVI